MASPRPKDGSLDPSTMIIHDRFIVGSHKRDGHSKGPLKFVSKVFHKVMIILLMKIPLIFLFWNMMKLVILIQSTQCSSNLFVA